MLAACQSHVDTPPTVLVVNDPFKPTIEVTGIHYSLHNPDLWTDVYLTSSINKKSGAVDHGLFAILQYTDGKRNYTQASDDSAVPLPVQPTYSQRSNCSRILVCDYQENILMPLSESYLRAKLPTGMKIKIWARDGDSVIMDIDQNAIAQQLDAATKVQAEVGHRVPASAAPAASTDPGGAPPVLGVQFMALDKPKLAQFQIGSDHGVMLITVAAGSPAAKAGLQVGNVVLRFNGTPVATNEDLQNAVARVPPHGKVPVEFWQVGQEKASSASIQF